VQPALPREPVIREPDTAEPRRPPAPGVAITIPAPEAFIMRTPAPPQQAEPRPAYPDQPIAVLPSPEGARIRYFQGDTPGAVRVYERVIARGRAAPEVYQEMGWLYYKERRTAEAAGAYRESLKRHREQLESGQDVQAALHGIRTCEAALSVLELE